MLKRKFSISDAYSFGVKNILDNYVYFLVAILVGILAAGFFLIATHHLENVDGIVKHFAELFKFSHEAMRDAGGALSHSQHSHEVYAQKWIPAQIAQFFSNLKQVHIHVDKQLLMNSWKTLVPALIIYKFVLDLLGVGYIKMALDAKDNKSLQFSFLYANYALVPSYFVVNLLVHLVTVIGFVVVSMLIGQMGLASMLLLLPGIFMHQRLRFAKFFVVDKNYRIDQALQASWNATEDCWVNLISFSVVELIVNALGHILILTSFLVFPLGLQVEADVYRQLTK